MATKYILDPSGKIVKIISAEGNVPETTFEDPKDSDYISDVNAGRNANVSQDTLQSFGLDIIGSADIKDTDLLDNVKSENYIVGTSKNDSSFGFMERDNTGQLKKTGLDTFQSSYRPFSSFTKKEGGSDSMPKAFADEFEMLSGLRLRGDEYENIIDISLFFASYLIESIVKLAAVEGIVLLNRGLLNESGDENATAERFSLRLGTYDFTEYEVFTKYVFNVLNYPHDQSDAADRLNGYFVGFASWLSPDAAIDLQKVANKFGANSKSSIDLYSNDTSTNNATRFFGPLFSATTEIAVASLSNHTSINRLKLLIRKFYQEKHWNENILYRAKDRNPVLGLFADLNFYNFKFLIERMQVGLKLLNKYYYDDSYLRNGVKDSPLNRVSAARSNSLIKETIAASTRENYSWHHEKSRGSTLQVRKASQTTSLRALPQAFNMHSSFFRAIVLNKKDNDNSLNIPESIQQNFYRSKEERRLPSELVKKIENYLESEYMPFYFHDLRTNEILSFHAFIENIGDSYTPEYNPVSGFGRIDDVRSYVKTTRSINMSFTIAATSEEDHDLMWFQINKLVAMVYPQWSDAFEVVKKVEKNKTKKGDFKYPFTQVPTASPLIRLRVGDLIKSNYSRTNLSRLHGIGDRDDKDKGIYNDDDESTAERLFDEGIKKLDGLIENFNKEKDKNKKKGLATDIGKARNVLDKANGLRDKFTKENKENNTLYLQPGLYRTTAKTPEDLDGISFVVDIPNLNKKSIKIDHEVEVDFKEVIDKYYSIYTIKKKQEGNDTEIYGVSVLADSSKIRIMHKDTAEDGANKISGLKKAAKKILNPTIGDKKDSNNPITRSYESGMSRGLAGFITNLDFGYNESTWETSRIGSKAPIMVKVNIAFSPIHDIPPGLDHNGMLRAPVYNVGRVNNEFFGDPHDGSDGHGSGRAAALNKYFDIVKKSEEE